MTDLPSVPFPSNVDLQLPSCGLATKTDGSRIVVLAGGAHDTDAIDQSYIYDLNQGLFLPGPPLPQPRVWGRAVQYQDSFLIVGGGDSTYYASEKQEEIYWFDPESESWITLPVVLDNPDFVTAALMVPDYFNVDCHFDS